MYTLYIHQEEAVNRIIVVYQNTPGKGFLLADAPRVGKTYVALEFIKRIKKRGLVLAPASVVSMWRSLLSTYNIEATVVSYEYFRTHSSEFNEYEILILDEAHKCKNSRTQITRRVIDYARNRFVLAMTGTPFQNAPGELKTIIDIIKQNSKIVYIAARWIETRWGKEFVWIKERLSDLGYELKKQPWYLRREIHEVVGSLPPIQRTVIEANKNDWKNITNTINTYLIELYKQEQNEDRKKKLYKIIHGIFEIDDLGVLFNHAATIRHNLGVAKALHAAEYVIDLINNTKEQILIFTHHTEVRNIIVNELKNNKITYDIISGDTRQLQRGEITKAFQEGRKQVLILSTRAAGEGLTLNAAKHAVFAELDWNPAVLYQAENRMRNINDNECRIVHYIIAPHPLEKRMVQLINNKATAALRVYTNEITTIKKHKIMKTVKIGFSELPIIMGKVSYVTPLQLWRRKLGYEPPQEDSLQMMIGRTFEVPLFKMFCEIEGFDFDNFSHQQRVEVNEWLVGHCDFVDKNTRTPYEIKVVSSMKNIDGYIIQLNAQMHALGVTKGYLIVLHNNYALHKIEHEYDSVLWQQSFDAAQKFYDSLVSNTPPIVFDNVVNSDNAVEINTNTYLELNELIKEYTQIDEQLKVLDERKKSVKTRIEDIMRTNAIDKIKVAYGVVSKVKSSRKSLDEQALRAVVNLDEFYKTVEYEYYRITSTSIKTKSKTNNNV